MHEEGIDRVASAMHHVQHPGGEARFEEDLGQALPAQRGPLRGFEHKRIAGDDREGKHPQRDHHGEVEGRDSGAHSDRKSIKVLVYSARHVPQRPALEKRRGTAREVDHLDPPAHLTAGLVQRLAVMAGDDRGQLLEVLLEQSFVAEHEADAFHDRRAGPRLVRGGCRPDGRVDLVASGERDLVDDLARRGVVDGESLSPTWRQPPLRADKIWNQSRTTSFIRLLMIAPSVRPLTKIAATREASKAAAAYA